MVLTLYVPSPQNGQTHSTIYRQQPRNCLKVIEHFEELVLKVLRAYLGPWETKLKTVNRLKTVTLGKLHQRKLKRPKICLSEAAAQKCS